jgi:hypothetical protein
LRFPPLTIFQEFFFIVKEFFSGFRRKFKIGTLYDCVDWAGLLAKAAIDTFGHINVISGRSSTAIFPWLCIYRDGLCWTYCLAQFACYASFLTIWISAKGMLSPEPRT